MDMGLEEEEERESVGNLEHRSVCVSQDGRSESVQERAAVLETR